MLDLQVKLSCAIAIAWILTRAVRPADGAAAHRVWIAAMSAPLLALSAAALLTPVAYGQLEPAWRERLQPLATAAPWFAGLYAAGALLLLARVGHGVWVVRSLIRRARPVVGLPVPDDTGLARHGRLRESELAVPVTAGFLRPVVLLPRDWRALSPDALTAILRHEASHARRCDGLVMLAASFMEAVFWINPLVWVAGRNLRWTAELAADHDAAAGMAGDAYASALLQLACRWRGAAVPRAALTLGAASGVSRRLDLLLREGRGTASRQALLMAGALVVVCGAVLSAAIRVGDAPTEARALGGWTTAAPGHAAHGRHAH